MFSRYKQKRSKNSEQRQPHLMEGQNDYAFRRSRTITGTVSSEVTTVPTKKSHLESERHKLHRLRRHRRLIFSALGTVFAITCLLMWMIGQFITIPPTFDFDNDIVTQPASSDYRRTLDDYFVHHPSERFFFSLNSKGLNDTMTSRHPEIKEVSVVQDGAGEYRIVMSLRRPLLGWKSGAGELFVDESGRGFGHNYFRPPTLVVNDQSGIQLKTSAAVASNRFLSFLGRVIAQVNQSDVADVEEVIIPGGTTRQINLRLQGQTYPIKIHSDRDAGQQAGDVVNAVKYLQDKHVTPEYIDVRVVGKAYYR